MSRIRMRSHPAYRRSAIDPSVNLHDVPFAPDMPDPIEIWCWECAVRSDIRSARASHCNLHRRPLSSCSSLATYAAGAPFLRTNRGSSDVLT
jgi:hypothetical protein